MSLPFSAPVIINLVLSILLLGFGIAVTVLEVKAPDSIHRWSQSFTYWPQYGGARGNSNIAFTPVGLLGDRRSWLAAGITSMCVGFINFSASFGWMQPQKLQRLAGHYSIMMSGFVFMLVSALVGTAALVVSVVSFAYSTFGINNSDYWKYTGVYSRSLKVPSQRGLPLRLEIGVLGIHWPTLTDTRRHVITWSLR
jgi:hypothetical protein